jgi:hypothetical protein
MFKERPKQKFSEKTVVLINLQRGPNMNPNKLVHKQQPLSTCARRFQFLVGTGKYGRTSLV